MKIFKGVSVPTTPCLEAAQHANLEVPTFPFRTRECRCATAQRAQCADENMRTLEKPDGFASELFLDQLILPEKFGMSTFRLRGSRFVYEKAVPNKPQNKKLLI
jgi:hypothetical protein